MAGANRVETTEQSPETAFSSADKEVNCLNNKVVYDYICRKAPARAGYLFLGLP